MDTAVSRPELLLVADAVAREKNIDREEVLEAMEQAIQKAGRAKYGHEKDIRATIDRKNGDVRLSRWTELVETVENEETQIPVQIAKKFRPDLNLGEFIADRFRAHCRADRETGDCAAGARIRAQAAI
jgi:N utilization substance protein A